MPIVTICESALDEKDKEYTALKAEAEKMAERLSQLIMVVEFIPGSSIDMIPWKEALSQFRKKFPKE